MVTGTKYNWFELDISYGFPYTLGLVFRGGYGRRPENSSEYTEYTKCNAVCYSFIAITVPEIH